MKHRDAHALILYTVSLAFSIQSCKRVCDDDEAVPNPGFRQSGEHT